MSEFDYNLVKDPQVFEQNRLPPHSDHVCYANYREISDVGQTSLRTSLNGKWFFHYATSFDSLPNDFEKEVFTVLEWQPIEVPGHFETQGFGHPHYTSSSYPWDGREDVPPGAIPLRVNVIGSYVTFFNRNVDWDNCFICFEGVSSAFVVYLNGHYVGYATDSFTPSEFDLTPYIRDGQNRLAVRVFKYSSGSHLENQSCWNLSGIFRSVYLYTKPPLHLEDIFVHASLTDDYVHPVLTGQAKLSAPGALQLSLSDKRGALVSQCFMSDEQANIEFELDVSALDIKPWSAEFPHLYTLVCQILPSRLAQAVQYHNDGSLVDPEHNLESILTLDDASCEACCIRIGFRRFELKDGVMCINGQRIVFHGVNRIEFSAVTGRAVTSDETYQDLLTMKRNNINAVRTSSYPNSTIFYNYCDLLGLYVIDETNLDTHSSWRSASGLKLDARTLPNNRPEWKDAVLSRGRSMLERNKNHACVLMWSCGNVAFGDSTLQSLAQYFKHADPSRLVHYDGISQEHSKEVISDILCRQYPQAAQIPSLLLQHPERPLIASACSHSMGQSNGGMLDYAQLFRTLPRFQGSFICDFKDQAFYVQNHAGNYYYAYGGDFDDYPNDGNCASTGIAFADGAETSKMMEVKYCYQNFEIKPEREGVQITNYSLFTDLNEFDVNIELQLNGEKIGSYITSFNLKPGCSERFKVYFERLSHSFASGQLKPNSEYLLKVSLLQKENTLWADAGFEVAFGQGVLYRPDLYVELPNKVTQVKLTPDVAESCVVSAQDLQAQALVQAQALAHVQNQALQYQSYNQALQGSLNVDSVSSSLAIQSQQEKAPLVSAQLDQAHLEQPPAKQVLAQHSKRNASENALPQHAKQDVSDKLSKLSYASSRLESIDHAPVSEQITVAQLSADPHKAGDAQNLKAALQKQKKEHLSTSKAGIHSKVEAMSKSHASLISKAKDAAKAEAVAKVEVKSTIEASGSHEANVDVNTAVGTSQKVEVKNTVGIAPKAEAKTTVGSDSKAESLAKDEAHSTTNTVSQPKSSTASQDNLNGESSKVGVNTSKIPVLTKSQTQALAQAIVMTRQASGAVKTDSVKSIIQNMAEVHNHSQLGQLTPSAMDDESYQAASDEAVKMSSSADYKLDDIAAGAYKESADTALPLEQMQMASKLAKAQTQPTEEPPKNTLIKDAVAKTVHRSQNHAPTESEQRLTQSLIDARIDSRILSGVERAKPRASMSPPVIRQGELEFLKTSFNYGVNGYNFKVLFSVMAGGLVSYQVDDQEFMKGVLKPNFWRAPTDNERRCDLPFVRAVWKNAGAYAKCIEHHGIMLRDCACITFKYQLATLPIEAFLTIEYRVYATGQIKVDVDYTKAEGLPDMPEFGVLIPLKNDFEQLHFYARGPQPNYPDRKMGYPIGYYEGSSTYEEFELYSKPQECGNHCDTRFFVLLDKEQYHGILFNCYDEPFNFSALPWSPTMIEEAQHPYELSEEVEQTFVKISSQTSGVGSDWSLGGLTGASEVAAISCGVPNQDHHLSFVLSGF